MRWLPWRSAAEAARIDANRRRRFVQVARDAHERTRGQLGPQPLKPRPWEAEPSPKSSEDEKAGSEAGV